LYWLYWRVSYNVNPICALPLPLPTAIFLPSLCLDMLPHWSLQPFPVTGWVVSGDSILMSVAESTSLRLEYFLRHRSPSSGHSWTVWRCRNCILSWLRICNHCCRHGHVYQFQPSTHLLAVHLWCQHWPVWPSPNYSHPETNGRDCQRRYQRDRNREQAGECVLKLPWTGQHVNWWPTQAMLLAFISIMLIGSVLCSGLGGQKRPCTSVYIVSSRRALWWEFSGRLFQVAELIGYKISEWILCVHQASYGVNEPRCLTGPLDHDRSPRMRYVVLVTSIGM
jgi:hypothetical protein